jgi:hypothetical protein
MTCTGIASNRDGHDTDRAGTRYQHVFADKVE